MKETNAQLVKVLDMLSDATTIPCVWKQTAALLPDFSLPEIHRIHVQPFCCKVKELGQEYELRCMRNDAEYVSRKAIKLRRTFIHICHAGVAEVVTPIFNGGRYGGAILRGPFQTNPENCIYPSTQDAYAALPQFTARQAEALGQLDEMALGQLEGLLDSIIQDGPQLSSRAPVSDGRIRDAIRALGNNFRQPPSIRELARRASLSPSRFLHRFKEQVGISCRDYILNLRLSEAARLLVGTDLRMDEIAEICGISGQSRFSALFKRHYKKTPTEYRRCCRICSDGS